MKTQNVVTDESWMRAMEILGGQALASEAKELGAFTVIRRGFKPTMLKRFAEASRISQAEMYQIVHVTKNTFTRRLESGQRLSSNTSDALFRMAKTLALAEDALGDIEAARDWMKTANEALGGEIPLQLLDTDAGAEAVRDVLGRIKYGVYS